MSGFTEEWEDKLDFIKKHYGEPLDVRNFEDYAMGRSEFAATYRFDDLIKRIPADSEVDVQAQVDAIQWLIGRCEDQFVKAWLVSERNLCKNAGGVKP